MSCGTALERRCPSCGTAAPDGARFCMACGAQLGPAEQPQRRRASAGRSDAADTAVAQASGSPTSVERRRCCSPTCRATRRSPRSWTPSRSSACSRDPHPSRRGGRRVRRICRQVHRRQRDGDLRRPGRARRRCRAGGARRARDAGGDGRDQRAARPQHGVTFELCVGINTGEVLAGERRRQLHGDRRQRQRRRPPASRCTAGERDRR